LDKDAEAWLDHSACEEQEYDAHFQSQSLNKSADISKNGSKRFGLKVKLLIFNPIFLLFIRIN